MPGQKALLLLSGGIDSPVAGWTMKRKGIEVVAVHFSAEPISDRQPEGKSRKLAKKLGFGRLFVVNISRLLKEISEKCEKKYYFVISKRVMMRIAEKIAKKEGCSFLITGENLGQVSSQTIQNLAVIDQAVEMPVIRPLIAMDKQEIIDLAKKIGSYKISEGREVCDALGPEHPSTRAKLEDVLREEGKLDNLEKLAEPELRAEFIEKVKEIEKEKPVPVKDFKKRFGLK
jgi:thiamine biosynthesis protein ThiI